MYAQYDPATASKKGGVPYVTDIDVSKRKEKLNLQDTYDHILADCSDEVIAQLPKTATDVTHPSQATGNAIRAKVLFQMKKYQEALPYAQAALQLNGQIEDRSTTAVNGHIGTKYFGTEDTAWEISTIRQEVQHRRS